jgi:hypothetical protein
MKRKKKKKPKPATMSMPVMGPPPGPAASSPAVAEASLFGGGSSKGMLIFGVLSAVAIGAYLLMQKQPTTPPRELAPHEPRQ